MGELLRNRKFLFLWGGQAVSSVGDWIRNMAITYWVYEVSGHSPVATAAVMVAEYLPMLVLAPMAGVFVDRWSRRRTMLWAHVANAGLSLGFLAALGLRSLPLAFVIAFLASTVTQFYNPARGAMIPVIVPRAALVGANSLSQTTGNLALVLGPMIGTGVYFALGPAWSFGLDAISFLLSAVAILLAALPENGTAVGGGGIASVAQEWREGLAFVRSNRPVRTVLLAFFILMLGGGAANVSDLYLVTRNLQLPESTLSLVIAAQGLASVVASLGMAAASRRLDSRTLLWGGLLVLAVAVTGLGFAMSLTAVLVWTGLAGVGVAMSSVGQGTIVQVAVPVDLRGRVFGVTGPVITAATLVGTALGGLVAGQYDVRVIYLTNGVLSVLGAGLAFLGLRPGLDAADENAAPEPRVS